MEPERLERIKQLFDAALELGPVNRAALLDPACQGDPELRAEVERLLAENEAAGSSLREPVVILPSCDPQEQQFRAPGPPSVAPKRALDSTVTINLDEFRLNKGDLFAGRYLVDGEIGRGGFGVVYEAFDQGPMQRRIALKLIRLPRAANADEAAVMRQRFFDEAKLAGSLSHPNIATIFDAGDSSGCLYMTQELVPGSDLRKLLRRSDRLPLRSALNIARQICDGLAHAHGHAIVHRDIKPGNVMVDRGDRIKITDFGLAQPPAGTDSTVDRMSAGTPGYMAPEQLRAERVDSRADIFSLGCVLYEMLTGRATFIGSTVASTIEKTLHAIPPAPSRIREDLPRSLDRIVARALHKDPAQRYSNVVAFAQDLLNYEQFEYLVAQEQGINELVSTLDAGKCVLFLGLHLPIGSTEERSPTSGDLIAEYLAERVANPPDVREVPRLAQDLEMEHGRAEMLRHLITAVRNPRISPREMIRRVARLHFPVIVTTRYDTFLEEELSRTGRKFRRVLDCREVPEQVPDEDLLVRLFGSVEVEDSILVTEDDLWAFYGRFPSVSDELKSLFARCALLFVGYRAEDEGFRHLFSEVIRFRAGVTGGCYLAGPDVSLTALRWSRSKGLRLIDAEPGPFLSHLEEALVERRREKSSPVESEFIPARLPSRPYKFLNYFEADDESIFFGRVNETHKLISKIHSYSLNVLYAPSGAGKTSLILAGLMPQLRREGCVPIYVRVFDDPAAEIRRATIEAAQGLGADLNFDESLELMLPRLATRAGQRLVLFVDQFEEIFVRYGREARDHFAELFESILSAGKGQVRFVFSLREDFLARLSELRDRIPTIFHNEFRLEPLTGDASRAAIVEPAKLLGLAVDSELVDRLLDDLNREGIDPPQLQIVCDTLFDHLPPGEKRLTLKLYLELGETRKILANYLEQVLRELPAQEREATRHVLKSLVTSEDTKTICRIDDLVRVLGQEEQQVSRIIGDLSNRRLIRRVRRDEGVWYELTHEYLVACRSEFVSMALPADGHRRTSN